MFYMALKNKYHLRRQQIKIKMYFFRTGDSNHQKTEQVWGIISSYTPVAEYLAESLSYLPAGMIGPEIFPCR